MAVIVCIRLEVSNCDHTLLAICANNESALFTMCTCFNDIQCIDYLLVEPMLHAPSYYKVDECNGLNLYVLAWHEIYIESLYIK